MVLGIKREVGSKKSEEIGMCPAQGGRMCIYTSVWFDRWPLTPTLPGAVPEVQNHHYHLAHDWGE